MLEKPIADLYQAFSDNDLPEAGKQYRLLVDRCNKCHIDLEIDKQVRY